MSSAQTSFASAEIELVIHATEDVPRILSVVEKVIGIKADVFTVSNASGHFGNQIRFLRANLGSRQATELAYTIARLMSRDDRAHMHDNFDLYLDERNSLYVRISKQKLFEGRVELSQADSLKIRFRAVRRFQSGSEMDNYRRFLAGD